MFICKGWFSTHLNCMKKDEDTKRNRYTVYILERDVALKVKGVVHKVQSTWSATLFCI